jgi:hypothetical protein
VPAWPAIAVSQTGVKAILADRVMINAHKKSIPGNGKPFPDGSMIVKIEWNKKQNTQSPSEIRFVHRKGFQEIP